MKFLTRKYFAPCMKIRGSPRFSSSEGDRRAENMENTAKGDLSRLRRIEESRYPRNANQRRRTTGPARTSITVTEGGCRNSAYRRIFIWSESRRSYRTISGGIGNEKRFSGAARVFSVIEGPGGPRLLALENNQARWRRDRGPCQPRPCLRPTTITTGFAMTSLTPPSSIEARSQNKQSHLLPEDRLRLSGFMPLEFRIA